MKTAYVSKENLAPGFGKETDALAEMMRADLEEQGYQVVVVDNYKQNVDEDTSDAVTKAWENACTNLQTYLIDCSGEL